MGYREELGFISSVPDDEFPDFLFNPIYNNFGDEYYQLGISENPLVIKARSIRHKYSDFFSYMQALEDYNDYMKLLEEKYGGLSIIKNAIKAKREAMESGDSDLIEAYGNIIEDIIPPKPIPKNKKSIRQFIKAGVIPSKQLKQDIDSDDIIESAKFLYPDASGEELDSFDIFKKPPKRIRKAMERATETIAARDRRENLYSKFGNNNGADFIVEYLNNASKGYYTQKGEYKEKSLSDLVKEAKRRDAMIPELYEDELQPDVVCYSGFSSYGSERLVHRKEMEQIEIAKQLYSIGIDVTGNMSKNMSKQAIKVIRRSLGADSTPMTKKELKQQKKRQKKENKRLETQRDNDKLLSELLLKNKFSFQKDGGTLSLSLNDLMRGDD